MENKILTAEESYLKSTGCFIYHTDIKKAMIEFAKLHVNAALKEALESIPCLGSSSDIPTYEEVEEAVLNCYPENLIQ